MADKDVVDPMIDLMLAVRELERTKAQFDESQESLNLAKKRLVQLEETDGIAYKNYKACEARVSHVIAKMQK